MSYYKQSIMKITKELLRKYSSGFCTEEEKKAIEKWLDQKETSLDNKPIQEIPFLEKKAIWAKVQRLSPELQSGGTSVISLYKQIIRYAAVACIAAIFFSAGYFMASQPATYDGTTRTSTETTDHLQIASKHDKITKFQGSHFNICFEGTIALYNASTKKTVITCGNKTFTLQPATAYYLQGSHESPALISENKVPMIFSNSLGGHYSVLTEKVT